MNAFKLYFIKKLIYLKNHLYVIPLLASAVSLAIITLTMHVFTDAIVYMPYTNIDAFFYFIIVLASIMSCVSYLMANGKRVSRVKKTVMLVMFFLLIAVQIALDVHYVLDVAYQIGRDETLKLKWQVPQSSDWTVAHIVALSVTALLAVAAPLLQPLTRKIQLGVREHEQPRTDEHEA